MSRFDDVLVDVPTPPKDDSERYAPVLQRMIEILGSDDSTTFGAALDRASSELKIEVPGHMQVPLLTTAFKIIGGRKIPGLPEA